LELSDVQHKSQFGHDVRKCRLANTVASNLNIMVEVTEMSQRKKAVNEYTVQVGELSEK